MFKDPLDAEEVVVVGSLVGLNVELRSFAEGIAGPGQLPGQCQAPGKMESL